MVSLFVQLVPLYLQHSLTLIIQIAHLQLGLRKFKIFINMARRTTTPIKRLSLLEIFKSLDESFDSVIETTYTIINFGEYFACRFKTNSANEYDLEFHESDESSETLLGGVKLGNIIKPKNDVINCLDVAFTLTAVKDKENPDEFEIDTNQKEQYELMGRITYILKKIVNTNNKCNLFIIGGDARRNRLKMYEMMFKNNFKDMFDLYYAKSKWHGGVNLYLLLENQ